jgi:transcriptional regulator of acetoin/glycerol metabolism
VQAHGGTLFLDEIGDMPLSLQAHLLRVLQERQVMPLGGSRAIPVDVNVVCATHRNLREMIQAQTFREDLYYRPQRSGPEAAAAARTFRSAHAGGASAEPARPENTPRLSAPVRRLFQHYGWPGNVRQLHNVLRTACVMAGPGQEVLPEHLPDDFVEEARQALQAAGQRLVPVEVPQSTAGMNQRPSAVAHPDAPDHPAGGGPVSRQHQPGRPPAGVSRNTVYRALRTPSG